MTSKIATGSTKKLVATLLSNKWVLTGLLVKLVLACLFASTYLSDLFIPFVKTSVQHSLVDAYVNYYSVKPSAFPYPPIMLYILAAPMYIASFFSMESIGLIDLLAIKLPLLLGDFIIFVILVRWLHNVKAVTRWYWFNPVICYICYIHGQLDIIPTALLCIALYYLFTDRLLWFAVFLALACATKFHIVITIPLLLVYLYKTKKISISNLAKGLALMLAFLFLLNLPFILQENFIRMVYQNEEQAKVFTSSFSLFENYQVILIPAFYMIMLYLMIDFNFINKDVLLIFLALSFGIITFFILPGQGWYMWSMPFLIYFIIRFQYHSGTLFILFNLSYFIFFTVFPKSDIPLVAQYISAGYRTMPNLYEWILSHGMNPDIMVQLAFTFLQTSLFLLCSSVFRLGILKIRGYKIYHKPYLIGICGDSGSGKSTFSSSVQNLFGSLNTLIVKGDDMHRWERGHEKWNELTHLNPKANWLHRDLSQLINLKAGKDIMRRHYDHGTGKFTKEATVHPNKIIIYEGLHSFYLKEASNVYDLKVFMKPSEELRRYWKIKRDVEDRGYTKEKVLESIEKRMRDSLSHILNQVEEADIVFAIESRNPVEYGQTAADDIRSYLRIECSNDIYFEQLLDALRDKTQLLVVHEIDHNKQEISIEGDVRAEVIDEIAFSLGLDIEDLTGANPVWSDQYLGLMQLFLLYQIITQFKRNGMLIKTELI